MLEQRRKFQALVLVYRCINKQAPTYIQKPFKITICNCNLKGSGTLLMLPNFRMAPQVIFVSGRQALESFTPLC